MSAHEDFHPSDGGETFLTEVEGRPAVVRIYSGTGAHLEPTAVHRDAAVLRWLRGVLPVPEVVESRMPQPGSGLPAVLVTSSPGGERGDALRVRLDPLQPTLLARPLAQLLHRLGTIATLRPGRFMGPELRIEAPLPEQVDLPAWLHANRRALPGWSAPERKALLRVAELAQGLLDVHPRSCLVHGRLDLAHVHFDPERLTLSGVVGWEHAYSGSPFADLGRLLRFERSPALERALLTQLDALDDELGLPRIPNRLELARAADLVALVGAVARRSADEASQGLLREIARTGELHVPQPAK